MEIDLVGGGAGVTSGASGSGPSATSATAARRRTPGRWRRIPRATGPSENVGMARLQIDPVVGGAGVTTGESGSRSSATAARPRTAGPSEELPRATLKSRKKIAPARRAERYDPSPSTARLQETGVDLPSFRFKHVSDPKNPSTFTTVLEETIPPPTTVTADQYHPSPSTGLLLQERPRPPVLQMDLPVVFKGSRECEDREKRSKKFMLEQAQRLEKEAEECLCDTEEHTEEEKAEFRASKLMDAAAYRSIATTEAVYIFKPPSDTIEEHLTAEEMERQADISGWPVCSQAQHFATLALEWYNSTKKTHKLKIAKVSLSKCFTDVDYNTYAHVNFTATSTPHSHSKRLFFAELMLAPSLVACKDTEPMRVLSVSAIDDYCFGGCHEMVRDIKGPVRKDMDYERCHACSGRIKHPKGDRFVAGHNRTRMPYVSAFPWTYKSQ